MPRLEWRRKQSLIELLNMNYLFPKILQEGFSAYKSSLGTSANTTITNWSVASPSFSSSNFIAGTGIFTVPISGVYATQATISYVTNSAISTQLGASIAPTFSIRQFTPTATDLIIGMLPVFYTNLVILSLRTILASSTVTLSGVLQLTQGDTLGIYYDSDGMSLALTLQNIQWATYRLQ